MTSRADEDPGIADGDVVVENDAKRDFDLVRTSRNRINANLNFLTKCIFSLKKRNFVIKHGYCNLSDVKKKRLFYERDICEENSISERTQNENYLLT